jgi:microsomal dipeptidase-like Zn-dependent dipeptidase
MIVDWHAHYPMHVRGKVRGGLLRLIRSAAERRRLLDYVRASLVGFASLFKNYETPFSGPRVRIKYMRKGEVGVALSVLYSFFDEIDGRGKPPRPQYLPTLERQLELVEKRVGKRRRRKHAVIAHNPAELNAAREAGKLALIHCVEGGFHLGADEAGVRRAVEVLAGKGVAYITLAHLIYRQVATDSPAIPFLPPDHYRDVLPQPSDVGLTPLGRAAVGAMVEHHVLIDISHMSDRAVADTFRLLDEIDPAKSVPVIATHVGFRFGSQEYMLPPETLQAIAKRNGLVGLIFATYQLYDGPPPSKPPKGLRARRAKQFEATFPVLCDHIDAIHKATGSHRHTAIGSDFDGFIKPTLPGLRDMRDMKRLQNALRERYGAQDAELICSENSLGVLTGYWRGGPGPP